MTVKVINTMLSPLNRQNGDQGQGKDQNGQDQNGQDQNGQDQNGQDQNGQDQGKGDKSKSKDQGQDQGQDGDTGDQINTDNKGNPGGGTATTETPQELKDLIKDLLEKGEGAKLLDNNSAMEEALADMIKQIESTVEPGEQAYIVGDTSKDKINVLRESPSDKSSVQPILESVREHTNYLRSSLRQMVRAMEHTNTTHGVKKGNRLSNRTLVDTALSIRNGRAPQRAFYNTDDQIDTSIACAICLDESGSMGGSLMDATKMLLALTEPLDSIGGKVLAYGFRNGNQYPNHPSASHRASDGGNLIYDVFKQWDERFTTVKGRFAHTTATGGTPMADGIQFGLDSIKYRTEKHKILFVLTDGEPNYGHSKVIQWQLRVAKEMGVHIVGVGWGYEGSGVKTLYKDNVWCQNISEIPSALVTKLRTLLKERVGRKVA